jgi:hypothetical protein
MQRSIYLAKLIGPLLLVIGLSLTLNADTFRALAAQAVNDRALIYITGVLTLLAGLALVNAHNEWVGDWRVVITLLGWLFVISGVVRIIFTRAVESLGASMVAATTNAWIVGEGVVFLVLGAWLSFMGYGAQSAKAKRKR